LETNAKGKEKMRKPCKYCEEMFEPVTRHNKICPDCHAESMKQGIRNSAKRRKAGNCFNLRNTLLKKLKGKSMKGGVIS
jgi:protein-arginine kinase activator protein McsA